MSRKGEPGDSHAWKIAELEKAEGLRQYIDSQLQLHKVMILCKIYPWSVDSAIVVTRRTRATRRARRLV